MITRKTLALVLAALLVASLSVGVTAAKKLPEQASDKAHMTPAMDADGNRIFDDLDHLMTEKGPAEAIAVIVQVEKGKGPRDVGDFLGGLQTGFEFPAINAFAAAMNKGQIERLSHVPWVKQVEYDQPVYATLNTATSWFGVQKARADWGVTGDRNGNETGYTKDDIVVAVIDTGIDPNHVDLNGGKIIAWKDFVNSQTTPYDDHGHGTHCASIATGEGEGSSLYKGVAPGAALVGVKVLDSAGSGSMSNVDAGIQWCITNKATYGIEVISLSLGTSGSSDGTDSTSQMVNSAFDAGLVPLVAAGNSGPARYTVGSPGAAAKAITIGAMADCGELGFQLANFSSRGPTADGRTKPDICAPGVNIMAADSGTTNQYVSYSGTSMATPFTAGTCALMLDANPALTPTQIKNILTGTGIDWAPAGQEVDYGWGRLDGYAAIKSAGGYAGTGPAVPNHDYKSDSLTGAGAYKEFTYNVTSTSYPVAVTMIMPNWASSSNPDFDLYLYNPSGAQVASSTGATRQDQLGYTPTVTGNYKVKVTSYAGSGAFFIDVSAGTSGGGDNPPTCSINQPTAGQVVSGTYRVKVAAADDHGLSSVQVNIDGGSWVTITSNFDGSYYFYDWVTTGYANGSHTVNARATDTIAQTTNATPVTCTVNNGGGSYQHTLTFNGTVTSSQRDAWFDVNVAAVGYIYLTLNWGTTADLDFFVYGPSGAEVGRAYTTSKPETLRVFTDLYGTGKYRVKVNLYSGVNTSFTLTVDGYEKKNYTGSVSPSVPDSWVNVPCDYTGNSYFKLDWTNAGNDLDFFVYDPTGAYRSQAYTTSKPETLYQTIDRTGTWRVKVNLYSGSADNYTLSVYVPEDNLY